MHYFKVFFINIYIMIRYCNDIEVVFSSIGWFYVNVPAVSL